MRHIIRKKHGFTLVELLVVIAIMAILAAILIPSFSGYIDKAKNAQVYSELRAVALAAKAAHFDFSVENNKSFDVGYSYQSGLATLRDTTYLLEYVKRYLNNDDLFNNIKALTIYGEEYMVINYKFNDENYYYESYSGKVSIRKVPKK